MIEGGIKNSIAQIINRLDVWSTRKKISVLIIVWALIFIPSVIAYTSVHREENFAFYPGEASPIDSEHDDWDVVTHPQGSKEGNWYIVEAEKGEPLGFEWKARDYTDLVHIGQVNVYYETSWNSEGLVRLDYVPEESHGLNETWEGTKTFHHDGEVRYYFRVDKSDLPRFFRRASVILEGGNLYEDVRTGPPPLINFFFIPPAALAPSVELGGYFLSFYLYFSMFIILDSLMIFYLFKDFGESKAFLSSLLFIANPISFYTLFQDEGIIAFTIILSLLLIVKKRKDLGAVSIGLGSITKVWTGFLVPAQLFDRDVKFKIRIQHVFISAAVALSFVSFFYLLWGPKSLWFISFYGGSASKSTLGGVSIWATLSATQLVSASILDPRIILGFIGIVELAILYIAYRKDWDVMLVFTTTLAFFLIMYPKIHWEYYLMLFPTLLFYAVRDKRILSVFFGVLVSLTSARGIRNLPSYPDPLTTYSAFLFSLISTLLIIWMIYLFIKDQGFRDHFNEPR